MSGFIARVVMLCALFVLSVGVVPAVAQDSVTEGYGGAGAVAGEVAEGEGATGPAVAGEVAAGEEGAGGVAGEQAAGDAAPAAVSAPAPAKEGALPFTGFEALMIALGGLLLVGLGLTMRRLARAPA